MKTLLVVNSVGKPMISCQLARYAHVLGLTTFLGDDPVVRYLPNGTPTVTISLATTEPGRIKKQGENTNTLNGTGLSSTVAWLKPSASISKKVLK